MNTPVVSGGLIWLCITSSHHSYIDRKMVRGVRYIVWFVCLLAGLHTKVYAQFWPGPFSAPPEFAIKSNVLYGLTRTLNLGAEARFGEKYSLDVSISYNPWILKNDQRFRHLMVQPEIRYHFRDNTTGFFMGIHPFYTVYNVSKVNIPLSNKYLADRYEGTGMGVGLGAGYILNLGDRWNMELSAGFGFAKLNYESYKPEKNGRFLFEDTYNYAGPTRLGISLVYLIH